MVSECRAQSAVDCGNLPIPGRVGCSFPSLARTANQTLMIQRARSHHHDQQRTYKINFTLHWTKRARDRRGLLCLGEDTQRSEERDREHGPTHVAMVKGGWTRKIDSLITIWCLFTVTSHSLICDHAKHTLRNNNNAFANNHHPGEVHAAATAAVDQAPEVGAVGVVKNIANSRTTEIPDKSLCQQIYLKSFWWCGWCSAHHPPFGTTNQESRPGIHCIR